LLTVLLVVYVLSTIVLLFSRNDEYSNRKSDRTGRKLTSLTLAIPDRDLTPAASAMSYLETPKIPGLAADAESNLAPLSLNYHHQLMLETGGGGLPLSNARTRAILRSDRESQKSQYSAGGSSGSPGPTTIPVPR
jgi:hypothetical protein